MKRWLFAIALLASSPSFAQVAPGGEEPSPADDHPPEHPPTTPEPTDTHAQDHPVDLPVKVEPEPAPKVAPPPPPLPIQLQAVPASPDDDLTSAKFAESYHFDFHWKLLAVPERIVSLVLLPVGLLVEAVDNYALDVRLARLFDIFHGVLKIEPRFKFSFSDGPGAGLWLTSAPLFASRARARLGGLIRLNGDWQAALEYSHALLLPGGRGLRLRTYVDHDKNRRYYGIGARTSIDDARVIQDDEMGAVAEVDLQGIDHFSHSGVARLGIVHQRLTPGTDTTYPSLEPNDPMVGAPVGFNQSATYLEANVVGRYDTRDALGRPTRGGLAQASILARADLAGEHRSAATFSASLTRFVPVLADHRVLVFTAAAAAVTPIIPGNDIPLDSLVVIGRNNVRGYDRDRFADRYAVVGSVEYRFPIYEYLSSRAGLDAYIFGDVGTLWGTTPFSDLPFRYSGGAGVRAGSENQLELDAFVGLSPEGPQFSFGVDGAL